jgi:hypothetical protein
MASRWTHAHHRSVRPDAGWLASVIARLESCPALRRRLRVAVNASTTPEAAPLMGEQRAIYG